LASNKSSLKDHDRANVITLTHCAQTGRAQDNKAKLALVLLPDLAPQWRGSPASLEREPARKSEPPILRHKSAEEE